MFDKNRFCDNCAHTAWLNETQDHGNDMDNQENHLKPYEILAELKNVEFQRNLEFARHRRSVVIRGFLNS
jgi:hypothetical protein